MSEEARVNMRVPMVWVAFSPRNYASISWGMVRNLAKRLRETVLLGFGIALLFGLLTSSALAQELGRRRGLTVRSGEKLKSSNEASLEGASLQTVPEQELFKLRRADEFAKEGDFRSAIALWQSVLDAAGSQLITREDWNSETSRHVYTKYVTVANQIESTLAGLSPEGLRAYRLRADGEAKALLSNPDGRSRMEVLNEVVRRFFLSSEGDEAAYELACLNLDRYEFTGASRLLKKCLEEHPDCSVPRNELLLRLALANGRIGDTEAAEKALGDLASSDQHEASQPSEAATGQYEITAANRIQLVKSDLSERRFTPVATRGDWLTKFGQPDRRGTCLRSQKICSWNHLRKLGLSSSTWCIRRPRATQTQ